ncbi:MAG: SpoIIE family protein phosphatase [Chlorobi bacterium]|nr:SpoIIE family protein phosphatase [Chlorobiota bacterium]
MQARIKIFGFIYLTRGQFIVTETVLFTFFFLMTIFFFSWSVPGYVDDPSVLFHAKYLKYVTLILSFAVVIETQYYLNKLIAKQLEINEQQKKEIERQNEEIMKSIRYAGRIQEAVLPEENKLPDFMEYFIFYKPKDVVSGDFYWFAQHYGKTVIVAGDCTGHGVPGAFMSVLGISSLNDIINETEKELSSDEILNILRDKVITSLKQDSEGSVSASGMDLALVIIDFEKYELQYSGAKSPMFLIRNKACEVNFDTEDCSVTESDTFKLYHFKPDKMHIGLHPLFDSFRRRQINIKKGDTVYLFSDGFVDQMGGKSGKKLMNKRFKNMLLNIQNYGMEKQKNIVERFYRKWKGDLEQTDDIVLIGIRI